MILWKFKKKPETRGENYPCLAGRWVIEGFFSQPFSLSLDLVHQYQYKDNKEWQSSHSTCYGVTINTKFRWGISHAYYDGPHCFLSLGFLHFQWCGNPFTGWCKKCYDER